MLLSATALPQDTQTRIKKFNLQKFTAMEGYDPVSYFDGSPAEGQPSISFLYKGIRYKFTSAKNLNLFKNAPDKYEPAYGGWCAFAMGETGEQVKIDPKTFTITNGRLYLFYNFWGNNTLKSWKQNEKILKAAGDKNWEQIVR